ncbi:MAG TPA: serine/threonine-protein kinase [Gaiellaceae bacterium]|nr:serine/threonine-protein kinase [Gaiellaceae bacterium]
MRRGDEVAGRYRLEELQGRGPMSEVWRAHDDTLDRTVALKILSPTADLDRFRREAQALAALAHENVMRVYDYGEDEAGPFMAFEWLPGGTLEDRLASGRLPSDEVHRIAVGIAAGLTHLHGRGLVHRDLKPANILFGEEDRPKLGDFGLARRTAAAGTLTEAGTVLGTAAYISPEQAAGEPAGAASDVYSFGVILFRMLTGALPFVADDALALVNMHRTASPPAVESLQPDASPELAALTAAALRKDPAQRPADGAALLDVLGAAPTTVAVVADTEATRVLPASAPAPAPAGGFRRRSAAAVAAGVVALAAAGGVLAWAVTRSGTSSPAVSTPTGSADATHGGTATTHDTAPPPTTDTGRHQQHTRPATTATTAPGHTTIPGTTTRPATTTTPTTSATTTTTPATTANTTTTTPTTTSSVTTTATATT